MLGEIKIILTLRGCKRITIVFICLFSLPAVAKYKPMVCSSLFVSRLEASIQHADLLLSPNKDLFLQQFSKDVSVIQQAEHIYLLPSNYLFVVSKRVHDIPGEVPSIHYTLLRKATTAEIETIERRPKTAVARPNEMIYDYIPTIDVITKDLLSLLQNTIITGLEKKGLLTKTPGLRAQAIYLADGSMYVALSVRVGLYETAPELSHGFARQLLQQ